MADLSHFEDTSVGHIRPSNLGFDDHPCVRSMKVVKLLEPVRVGISMAGGLRITERIHVNTDNLASPPIFFTRQFLSDNEASILLTAETSKIDCGFLISRRLTKRTELDDLVRRTLKATLENILKREVLVWVATARHKWNGDSNTEESFLIAAVPLREGGKATAKNFPGFEGNSPFFKLCIGSLELDCMKEIRGMINSNWKASFKQTQVVEITKVQQGTTMGEMLSELIGFESHEILGITKCDPRSNTDRWDK